MNRFLVGLMFLIFACNQGGKKEIDELIDNDKPDDLVKGFYLIGEQKDTNYIVEILRNPYDPRISHRLKFKGISVYQSKMLAMKKISGRTPPKEITYKPDSVIVNFYIDWAKSKSYKQY